MIRRRSSSITATIGRQTESLNKLVEELDFLTLNTQPQKLLMRKSSKRVFFDQLLIESMSEFQLQIEQEERDVYIQVSPESAKIEGAILTNFLVFLVEFVQQCF